MDLFLLVGIFVALAILLVFVGMAQLAGRTSDERLARYVRGSRFGGVGRGPWAEGAREGRASFVARLDEAMARRGLVESVRRDLSRADIRLTVPEYLFINVAIVPLAFGVGYLISRFWISALILALVAAFLPGLYLKLRQRRRIRAFNDQLEDVLNLVIASMRAGYGLMQSFDYVSKRLPDPAGKQFARVVREVSLGLSQDEALANLLMRVQSEDLELIVTAIGIHHEVGGNLTILLESVSTTIRERVRIKREIQSLTAMQRGSAYILVALPFIVAGVFFMMSPTYIMRLFEPGPTLCIPFGAVVCMALGFVITRRIMDIEV
jgi:tight adherence protein B